MIFYRNWGRPASVTSKAIPNFDMLKITEGAVLQSSTTDLKLLSDFFLGGPFDSDPTSASEATPVHRTEAKIVILHSLSIIVWLHFGKFLDQVQSKLMVILTIEADRHDLGDHFDT